jgi:excinuclease ABC subunit C
VYALGRDLGLTVVPRSLVCIDISTNQGRDTVGSLVWFEAGRPKKSEYRKFRIRGTLEGGAEGPPGNDAGAGNPAGRPDDYAAIREVVTRYVQRRTTESRPIPDLMVIDGARASWAPPSRPSRTWGHGHPARQPGQARRRCSPQSDGE